MDNELQILVDNEELMELLSCISRYKELDIVIKDENIDFPDLSKKYPLYSLDPVTTTTIVVGFAGLITSVISLTTALIQYKSEKEKKSKTKAVSSGRIIFISFNNQIYRLDTKSNADEVQNFLIKALPSSSEQESEELLRSLLNIEEGDKQ
jgi:hypothetical protein